MAGKLHNHGRKLLFSELFKDQTNHSSSSENNNNNTLSPPTTEESTTTTMFNTEFGSPGSSVSLTSGSFLGSELGSTTTDNSTDDEGDTDFIAELTKQMTDYMLNDDAEDEEIPNQEEKEIGDLLGKLEKREKSREREQKILENGSGMRAVFLGRSGPRIESLGTGVFLPRGTPLLTEPRRKKSVCSTVLIPARVLQVLQHHFANSNVKPAIIQSNGLTSQYIFQSGATTLTPIPTPTRNAQKYEKKSQHQTGDQQHEDVFLPKEWIY